jgi:hypothetical protein
MSVDITIPDLIRQLRRVGLRPSERLTDGILAHGEAAVAPLLELARDTAALHGEEPGCWGPIHALRLLGELRPASILVPLLELLPVERESPDDRATVVWAQEVPQIIGRIGEPALAPLQAFADDETQHIVGRGAALHALAYTAVAAPAVRPAIVAALRERLSEANPELVGYAVMALSQLGEAAAYQQIMQAYRDGRVDRAVIPAAEARQWLLAKIDKRLGCVNHPLWERYDEHGPFTKEQYELAERYAAADDYDD